MTPEKQLARLRDPARWNPLEADFPEPAVASRAPHAASWKPRIAWPALVTVVVFVLLVVGTVSVLQVTRGSAPARTAPVASLTPSPSPSLSVGTTGALPEVSGTVLHTWTSTDPSLPIGRYKPNGEAIAFLATCTGGGSIQWQVSGHGETRLGCTGIVSSGPSRYARDGRLIAERKPLTVRITTTGHPRFAIRLLAVPVEAFDDDPVTYTVSPTGPDAPATLRTCRPADIDTTGTFQQYPHYQGGVITIRSTADSDCAIRTWPTLRYYDDTGTVIGKEADRFSSDGDHDEAPPTRLLAGGTAYIQIELFTLTHLKNCGAQQVHSLQLRLNRAAVQIPVPAAPATGHCTDDHTFADGVGRTRSIKPGQP